MRVGIQVILGYGDSWNKAIADAESQLNVGLAERECYDKNGNPLYTVSSSAMAEPSYDSSGNEIDEGYIYTINLFGPLLDETSDEA